MSARVILFHSLAHARAACTAAAEAGVPLTLRTSPGAAAYAGSQYLKAIVDRVVAEYPDIRLTPVIDCGGDPGTVLGALRIGWKSVAFTGPPPARDKLADIAEQYGAALVTEDVRGEVLDLLDHPDPDGACRRYLAGETP